MPLLQMSNLTKPGKTTCVMFASGTKSVARRLLRAAASQLANPSVARALSAAEDEDDIQAVLAKHRGHKYLEELALLVLEPAADAAEGRARLMALADKMRALDVACGGGHTAAADMLLLYASSQTWFTSERDYKVSHALSWGLLQLRKASYLCTYVRGHVSANTLMQIRGGF
jgi:hypothetical protein